uniref:Uncharacterized protein n=1 Tax=Panagrolaimus superbus TaxID=310955 RepID=A0A914YJJ7_9BILA
MNHTVNLQMDGYACGVRCTRMAESICLEGENALINPFYDIAERARVREIVHILAFDGCPDDWFPGVKTATDYLDSTEHLKIREKNNKLDTKENSTIILENVKENEKNFDVSVECLNEPMQNMDIDESVDIDEIDILLTTFEEANLHQQICENFVDYCKRKGLKRNNEARVEFYAEKEAAKEKLSQNENFKTLNSATVISENVQTATNIEEEHKLLSPEEETTLNNEIRETVATFCKRKKN